MNNPHATTHTPQSTQQSTSTRPWAVGQNYFVSWHPSGEHLVYGSFERYIGILLPKKFPNEKIRNFEFNNNKNDLHHEKEHKNLHIRHLNSFFYSSNSFRNDVLWPR